MNRAPNGWAPAGWWRCGAALAVVVTTSLLAAGAAAVLPLVVLRWCEGSVLRAAAAVGLAAVVTALLLGIRDRAATAVQHDLQRAVEPALWQRVLEPAVAARVPLTPDAGVAAGSLPSRLRTLVAPAVLDGLLAVATVAAVTAVLLAVRVSLAVPVGVVAAGGLVVLCGTAAAGCTRDRAPVPLLGAAFAGLDEIHVYGRESALLRRLTPVGRRPAGQRGERVEVRLAALAGAVPPLLAGVLFASAWRATGSSTDLLLAGATLAQLSLVLGRADQLVRSIVLVGGDAVAGAAEVLRAARPHGPDAVRPTVPGGGLDLDRVWLHRAGRNRPVLADLSLRVAPGEFVAVVGASGSGKSSLLRTIAGLEAPDRGAVRFDGAVPGGRLRPAVPAGLAFVAEDPSAPRGNVRSVVLGSARPGRAGGDDAAWRALRAVGLDDEVRRLPMGLSTVVSGDTAGFSVGQLQRMLVARALARQPTVVLLDGALDAVDADMRVPVLRHLAELSATRVVVTHRADLAAAADRVVVLDAGTVAQTGTYTELIAAAGAFSRLFEPPERPDPDVTQP